jgi:mRNA interferase MazF
MARARTPKRGEIWRVQFDPSVGAEIRKIRPAVVVSADGVGRLPLRIIVPVTDWKPQYTRFPWFVFLPVTADNGLAKDSGADAFQVKSISESRFVARIGCVTDSQADEIAAAVALCVDAP